MKVSRLILLLGATILVCYVGLVAFEYGHTKGWTAVFPSKAIHDIAEKCRKFFEWVGAKIAWILDIYYWLEELFGDVFKAALRVTYELSALFLSWLWILKGWAEAVVTPRIFCGTVTCFLVGWGLIEYKTGSVSAWAERARAELAKWDADAANRNLIEAQKQATMYRRNLEKLEASERQASLYQQKLVQHGASEREQAEERERFLAGSPGAEKKKFDEASKRLLDHTLGPKIDKKAE